MLSYLPVAPAKSCLPLQFLGFLSTGACKTKEQQLQQGSSKERLCDKSASHTGRADRCAQHEVLFRSGDDWISIFRRFCQTSYRPEAMCSQPQRDIDQLAPHSKNEQSTSESMNRTAAARTASCNLARPFCATASARERHCKPESRSSAHQAKSYIASSRVPSKSSNINLLQRM